MPSDLRPLDQIIKGIVEGDVKAFEAVYLKYSKPLYRYIQSITKNEEQSFDILQMTFIKVWNGREQINLEKSFQSYLYHIANNLSIDYLRQVAKNLRKQEEIWNNSMIYGLSVEEEYLIKEKNKIIDQVIEQLPLQQQRVFRLCKLEGYSYAEAAAILQVSASTVSNHLTAAVKSVRELLMNNKNHLYFILFIINELI